MEWEEIDRAEDIIRIAKSKLPEKEAEEERSIININTLHFCR